MLLYLCWEREKVGGVKKGKEGGKEKKNEKNNSPSHAVCILFMTVTYSTDTDIKTVVIHCYDVNMTV